MYDCGFNNFNFHQFCYIWYMKLHIPRSIVRYCDKPIALTHFKEIKYRVRWTYVRFECIDGYYYLILLLTSYRWLDWSNTDIKCFRDFVLSILFRLSQSIRFRFVQFHSYTYCCIHSVWAFCIYRATIRTCTNVGQIRGFFRHILCVGKSFICDLH